MTAPNRPCEVCGATPRTMTFIGTGRCSQLCAKFSDGHISRDEYDRQFQLRIKNEETS